MVLPGTEMLRQQAFDNSFNSALGGNYTVLAETLPRPAEWIEVFADSAALDSTRAAAKSSAKPPTSHPRFWLRCRRACGGTVRKAVLVTETQAVWMGRSLSTGVHTGAGSGNLLQLPGGFDGKGGRFDTDQVPVLVPDLEAYVPYIKAVFDNAPYAIPYYIGGEQTTKTDTVMQTLMELLAFDAMDAYPAEEVVALLEEKRIRRKYGMENMAYVRETVKNANIRFGLENKADDQTQYVGWTYGLEKIIMGFAVYDDRPMASVLPDATFYPWKETETATAYDVFRLKAFLDDLVYYAEQQKERKSFGAWKTFLLEEVLERSVAYSFRDEEELTRLYKDLEYMEKVYDDQEIPFSVFRYLVTERLQQDTLSGAYMSGRVSFLPVIPGRACRLR